MAPKKPAAPSRPQQFTQYDWARLVLQDANLPTTQNNIEKLVHWMPTEKPHDGTTIDWAQGNNPMNINGSTGLGGTPTGQGYDSFPDLTAGAQAMANYLLMPNYTEVYQNLQNNGSLSDFSTAVVKSPWAGGHYGYNYQAIAQTTLYPPITANGATVGSGKPVPGAPGSSSSATPGTCGAKGGGINLGIGPVSAGHLFNACQVKAITGGLLVGVGAVVMLTGGIMVAIYGLSRTTAGKEALQLAAGGGPVGQVAKVAKRAGGATRRAGSAAINRTRPAAPSDAELRRIEAENRRIYQETRGGARGNTRTREEML